MKVDNYKKNQSLPFYFVVSKHCPRPMIFAGIGTGAIQLSKIARKLNTPAGRAIDYKLSRDVVIVMLIPKIWKNRESN